MHWRDTQSERDEEAKAGCLGLVATIGMIFLLIYLSWGKII